MTEDRFENRLEALFDRPPALDDHPGFALRVQQRLASRLRLRGDLTAIAWIVAGGAVLWSLIVSLDTPAMAASVSQVTALLGAGAGVGGVWLLPALAIAGVLGIQALEDQLARD
jgi:hypothetical protein